MDTIWSMKDLEDHAQCRYHQNSVVAMDSENPVTLPGTCINNQLDQAMMEAKLALKICASLGQAVPFYLLAAEKKSARPTSEALTHTIDQSRAGRLEIKPK